MKPLTIDEMQTLQLELHDAYEDDWDPLGPSQATTSLLWTLGEAGEMIDILKKEGVGDVIRDPKIHTHFAEETCDLLMHLMDTLLCLKVTPEEIAECFRAKQKRNLNRWKQEPEGASM